MNPITTRNAISLIALAAWGALTGCSAFRPVVVPERHFVLNPVAPEAAASVPRPATAGSAVGVGPVRVAAYMLPKGLAIRLIPSEIVYSDTLFWAERLDKGVQRVLAMNLAQRLPHRVVKVPPWRPDEIASVVQVRLDQFDLGRDGQGVLEATWSVAAPGVGQVLHSGRSRYTAPGPPLSANPDGAVATLSALLGQLSEELAGALNP